MPRPYLSALCASLTLLAASTAAGAQSAEDLLRSVAERHQAGLEGIEDLTIVQDLMGKEMTIYMEVVAGMSGLRLVTRVAHGEDGPLRTRDVEDRLVMYLPWLAASRFEEHLVSGAVDCGPSEVDGRPVRVVAIESLFGFLFPTLEFLADDDDGARSVRLFVDVERLLPLRVELVDSAGSRGRGMGLDTVAVNFEEHQEVQGLRYPRRVVFDFSAAPIFGIGSERMREYLDTPPEGGIPGIDTEGADRVARSLIERAERLEREGMVLLIREVTVNTGPPPGGG